MNGTAASATPPAGPEAPSLTDCTDTGWQRPIALPADMPSARSDIVKIIEPPHRRVGLDVDAVWKYRRLVYLLILRDIQARYKQTVAGSAWVIVQPLLTMVVFSLFFGRLLRIPSDGLPYPVFALCGLVSWTYFVHALTMASGCVVFNEPLIATVYFPRLVLPTAAVLGALLDLVLALAALVPVMLFFGIWPGVSLLVLPLVVLLGAITALCAGVWLAAANVRYRDVRNALPFVSQLWLFVTPVGYPTSVIPERWRLLYSLNPMVGVVEGFRWSLTGVGPMPVVPLATAVGVATAVLITGLFYFRREEAFFADIV